MAVAAAAGEAEAGAGDAQWSRRAKLVKNIACLFSAHYTHRDRGIHIEI